MKSHMTRLAVSLCIYASLISVRAHADDTYVAPIEEAWETAQAQYAQGRYGDAFGNFFWAAIRDHAQAQEIVGMMYLLGPAVYGPAIRADRAEAAFWLGEAARHGRDVGRHMHCVLAQSGRVTGASQRTRNCLLP